MFEKFYEQPEQIPFNGRIFRDYDELAARGVFAYRFGNVDDANTTEHELEQFWGFEIGKTN
jgi:hypothetical protein